MNEYLEIRFAYDPLKGAWVAHLILRVHFRVVTSPVEALEPGQSKDGILLNQCSTLEELAAYIAGLEGTPLPSSRLSLVEPN